MSFILDALKKSETERQRADAPALYEMKMAPPRRGVATWLIVLAGLLVINIVVLSVVLIRGMHGSPPPPDTGTANAPPMVAPAATALPAAPPPIAAAPGATTIVAPGVVANVTPAAPPAADPTPAQDTALPPPVAAAAARADDDAPAMDAPRQAPASGDAGQFQSPPSGQGQNVRATGGSSGELPSYQQAATAPGANLPDLKLDLHAYATNPQDRFIFLNMTRLKEGQTSPQGVRVETITPDGAVLSWQGSKFVLQRQ